MKWYMQPTIAQFCLKWETVNTGRAKGIRDMKEVVCICSSVTTLRTDVTYLPY